MNLVRSIFVQIIVYGCCPVWALILLPTLVLPRFFVAYGIRLWGWSACWVIRVIGGIEIEERGKEHLLASNCIVAAKHQSALDTFAFPYLLKDPAIVLKYELTLIPLFGWLLMKAGMIKVERGAGSAALRGMLRDVGKALKEGRPLLIFPEGTRTPPGERRPYRRGIALLYQHMKLPVVPVALNSGVFWPRRTVEKFPGKVVIQYLPSIPPGLPSKVFLHRLQSEIEAATALLVEEGQKFRRG